MLTLRKNALLRFLLKSHFLAQIGLLKRFLQKVHDNFSSIERKDDLLFPLKDCFQDREASETNRPDVSQSKTAPFLSRLLEIPFRLFERFLSKLFQHLLSGFLKLPYIVFIYHRNNDRDWAG